MKILKASLASVSAILSLFIFAGIASPNAEEADPGWYLGLNGGKSAAKIDDKRITSKLLGNGFIVNSIVDDDRDIGFKVFGGYQFNRYLAFEGGYFDLGEFNFSAKTTPPGRLKGNIELRGINFDAVAMVPVIERLSAFGRVGVNYAEARDSFIGSGLVNVVDPNPSEKDANYKFGLGLQYDFTQALSMRFEAERYRINDAVGNHGDIDLFSLGLVYHFGAKAAAPKRVAMTPEPAASEEPDLVIVPVGEKIQQYCSILDLQFEINVDDIQRLDREKLDVLGKYMDKYENTTGLIEGHTDNVGSSADNMSLSQRRAESVVKYLVDNLDIAPSRLKAVGYGETRPIADNSTEMGKRQNRRIDAVIACVTDIEGLTPAVARVTMALEMEFDTNKADVRPLYRDELRQVADFMQAHPEVTATVEGHTSNQQGASGNDMQLSQRRAESVVSYLVTQFGVERARLSAAGFGHTRRVAYNTSTEGQQENRRVNIIFEFPDE